MMYFVGVPSLHPRADALTCAFGSFPGAFRAGERGMYQGWDSLTAPIHAVLIYVNEREIEDKN